MSEPPRTEEQARTVTRVARGALAEAGRPDLMDLVVEEPECIDGEWFGVAYLMLATEADARLIHKAIRIAGGMSKVCADCWIRERTLDCDHLAAS